jgi:uncharacterized OB-fold protein
MPKLSQEVFEVPWQLRVDYLYSYGELSKFFKEVVENKCLHATKCSECGKVFMPPRGDCPYCYTLTEWVPLSGKGVVRSCTYCYQASDSATSKFLDLPIVLAVIKLDGTDTYIFHVIAPREPTLGGIKPGTRVKVVFRENREGTVADYYFVPDEEKLD